MKKVKLGDICEILNGYAFKSSLYEENGLRVIRITNVQKGYIEDLEPKFYSIEMKNELKNYILKENDLLISLTGNVGRVGLLPKEMLPAALNQRVGCIRIKNKLLIDRKYLFHLMNNITFENDCINNSKGIAQKNLSTEWLKNYCINIPNIDKQKNVALKLGKIQEIIDTRKKQIDELDELIKSQFVEMFGDIKKNDKKWKCTTIGKECILNPKKIELQNISENCKVSFVAMPSVSENGNIDTSIIKEYCEVKKGFTYFAENDILFAKITPCMENGKGAVAIGLKNKVGFGSTEFHVLRPKENINSVWLYTLTSMKSFRIEAEKKMTGSAGQKRVPISFFETYSLGVPPIELQNQFADIVKQINKQKFEIQKSLEQMQKLEECLMNKYFGE